MEKFVIIRTLSQLEELFEYIKDKEFITYDTETDGLDKESRIIGFSISADIEVGYYVILSYWDKESQKMVDLGLKDLAKSFIDQLKTKKLIMHNAVFDCFMTYNNFSIDLMESVHTDTLVLGHLLDENRSNGLKQLGTTIFGDDSKKEQADVQESIKLNGGKITKDEYELYKADAELIARYGAKDAILTLKLFYVLLEDLFAQGLDKFFYEEECMPLLRGPTYQLNTTGLRISQDKLSSLRGELEAQQMELKAFIYNEITPLVKDKYPGTSKSNTFNIESNEQLSWLLFYRLGNLFNSLTEVGKDICKTLQLKFPYTNQAKREFISAVTQSKEQLYEPGKYNPKTKKTSKGKTIKDFWKYTKCDKETLKLFAGSYKWVEKLLEYKKLIKILDTYVVGIQNRMQYNIIRPSFLQYGTTSGRYSSRAPNFQNLPRDDKRVKGCIIARPGKIMVGADYAQLEPRIFASLSQDFRLLRCFDNDDDFYSTIGIEVFDKYEYAPKKEGVENAFGIKHKKLRDIAKVIALSSTYGTTPSKMAPLISKTVDEAKEVIDNYFEKFPQVKEFMLKAHDSAKKEGRVLSMFGRPRRMPQAKNIDQIYGRKEHSQLPYEARNILNLAVNHTVQSTAASVMNRAAIACLKRCKELSTDNSLWNDVKLILQVHDEIVLEGPEELADQMVEVLKDTMENTVSLPGVRLVAEPKKAYNLADLK